MTEVQIIQGSLLLLGVAGLGILTAGFFAVYESVIKHNNKKRTITEEKLNEVLDQVMMEVLFPEVEPIKNYRHNIHCPSCGRFAKMVLNSHTIVECKAHGVQVRWKDIPVDWATNTATGEIPTISTPHQELGVEIPLTGPINIIVPDDARELDMQPIDHRSLVQLIP